MSRVPEPTRSQFIEFANGEFAGDYGMTLLFIWDAFKHYEQIINTQDTKLDYMIELIKNRQSPVPEGVKLPKMLQSNIKEMKDARK